MKIIYLHTVKWFQVLQKIIYLHTVKWFLSIPITINGSISL